MLVADVNTPDGNRVTSVSNDKTVRLWDAVTGKQEHFYLKGQITPVNRVAFSPDGRYLATGNANGTIYILKVPPAKAEAAGK